MKTNELINLKEILSIKTFDKKRNSFFIWKNAGIIKMSWWCRDIIEEEGWRKIASDFSGSSKRDVNLDKYIIGDVIVNKIVYKVVYYKPYCKIVMKNKCTTTKLFDTYKEANTYAQQIREKCSNIIQLVEL